MPLLPRNQFRGIVDILGQIDAGKISPEMGRRIFANQPAAQQAFDILVGIGSPKGLDIFGQAPPPPRRVPGPSAEGGLPALPPSSATPQVDLMSLVGGTPRRTAQELLFDRLKRVTAGPTVVGSPASRVVDATVMPGVTQTAVRPGARPALMGGIIDIEPVTGASLGTSAGALDFPGFIRRSGEEILAEQLGPLRNVYSRGVPEDAPGLGFPPQPNVTRGVRVDTGIPFSAAGRPPSSPPPFYGGTSRESMTPGGPLAVRPTVVTGGTPPPPFYGGSRTEYMYPGGALARTQDLRVNPVDVRDITDTIVREATENAISGGVRTGNIGSILRNAGIAAGAGLGGYLLTRLLGIGSPSESVAPGQINQPGAGAVPPGTVAPTTPPSMIPGPDQRTGGVESAPASPASGSIAGQVVIQSPGDINESLREQMQQYAGVREPSKLPPSAIPKDKQLAAGYAEQEAFGRANMDSIVNELGLTGNLEIWARSNPLSAAQLYLRTAAKQRQATDLNQRTEFTAPQEIQPRGLSQQSPAVQGQMVNSQLGSDFLRNRTGNINLSTQAGMAPTQGAYDLRDSTAPLAQPTLVNPDAYAQQDEARREQMRQFIFENAAAGRGFA